MKKHNQHGSVSLIVTGLITVIVFGVLGFLFWQNVHQEADDTPAPSTPVTQESVAPATKTARIASSFPEPLSWTYPETWSLESQGDGPVPGADAMNVSQRLTLTSPSKKYTVTYTVALNAGIGGACEPGDDSIYSLTRQEVPQFADAVFIEEITQHQPGYSFIGALFQNTAETQAVTQGDSFCEIYMRDVIPLNDDGSMVLLGARIQLVDYTPTDDTYSDDLPGLQAALETLEYKEAVQILRSTVSQ